MGKLGVAGSVLAVVALSMSLGAPAVADQVVGCPSTTRVFTVQPNGDLWLFEHAAPETGEFSWSDARRIGFNWAHGRTLAGPSGEVRRFRWNGDSWDGGGSYDVILHGGWGWQRFTTPEHRNKITVDAHGDFYAIDDQDRLIRAFMQGGRLVYQVLDEGWGDVDLITASGPGTIYARVDNELHRFRFHRDSRRFYESTAPDVGGWPHYSKLFGAGGGVLYGVSAVSGDLVWRRDTAESDDVNSWSGASVIGHGWGRDVDTTAASDACHRKPERGPGTPQNGITANAPSAIVESNGKLRIAHREDNGTIRYLTEDSEGQWSSRVVGEGAMDISALSTLDGVEIAVEHPTARGPSPCTKTAG